MGKSQPKSSVVGLGTESIVYLNTSSQFPTVTKNRRTNGKTQYRFEGFVYQALAKLGAHVPTLISVSDDELVMSAFSGATIDDQIDLYEEVEIFRDIAKDLALDRRILFSGFGPAKLINDQFCGIYDSWGVFLHVALDKLRSSSLLSSDQKKNLSTYWQSTAPKIKLEIGMIVHGDFALSAIFVKDKHYEGIIDYGDAFIGDPLMDIAYFRFKEITKGYGQQIYRLLLEQYLQITAIDREYAEEVISLYMIYWAVERIHADNLEQDLINKFLEKTDALIKHLNKNTK